MMAKVKLNVKKLSDPTAHYISLVSRGANRTPFKIVKHEQEKSMIDLANLSLSSLFRKDAVTKAQEVQPTIVGFVTMNDEHFDTVKKYLKETGYKISDMHEESDGSVVFKQQPTMPDEFTVIKMAESLLVLVDGIDAEASVADTIYESLLLEDSFLPSQEIATKGLQLAMEEISAADEPVSEKVAKMELVTKDYNGYLAKLFNWVPAQLNTMATLLEKEIASRNANKAVATVDELRGVSQAAAGKANDSDLNINNDDGVNAVGTPKPIAAVTAYPKSGSSSVQGVSKSDTELFGTDTGQAEAATVELLKKMESMFGTLQASIGEQLSIVTDQVNTLSASVEGIKKSQDVLHDRVVETEKIAKSADNTIRGKLITSDNVSNDGTAVLTQKSANGSEDGYGGTIDTAFQQSVRKAAQPSRRAGR